MATLIIGGKRVKESGLVRGIRNNNAGNIRATKPNTWDGQTGVDDAGFAIFKSPEWCIRALGKLLTNYQKFHGINTVSGIISRYAPSVENNTTAYIESVARALNLDADTTFNIPNKLPQLMRAIIKHENGVQPYSDELIANGLAMIVGYQYA